MDTIKGEINKKKKSLPSKKMSEILNAAKEKVLSKGSFDLI